MSRKSSFPLSLLLLAAAALSLLLPENGAAAAARMLFGAAAVFFLPGWWLTRLSVRNADVVTRSALAIGLSFSVMPLLVYYLNRAGMPVTAGTVLATAAAVTAVCAFCRGGAGTPR